MIKVGNDGDVGDVEMQDLIFTSRGATAGLVLVEWNVKAASPGSAGLWGELCQVWNFRDPRLTGPQIAMYASGVPPGRN